MIFIVISAYIKKSQKSQMHNLMYPKSLKQQEAKSKIRKRKEIIKIRAENKQMVKKKKSNMKGQ
jgi:hypothetical protein